MTFYEKFMRPIKADFWEVLYYMITTGTAVPSQKWLTYSRYMDYDAAECWWKCNYYPEEVTLLDVYRVFGQRLYSSGQHDPYERLRAAEMPTWEDVRGKVTDLQVRDKPHDVTSHMVHTTEVTDEVCFHVPSPTGSEYNAEQHVETTHTLQQLWQQAHLRQGDISVNSQAMINASEMFAAPPSPEFNF